MLNNYAIYNNFDLYLFYLFHNIFYKIVIIYNIGESNLIRTL